MQINEVVRFNFFDRIGKISWVMISEVNKSRIKKYNLFIIC